MSIAKVINRVEKRQSERESIQMKRQEITHNFRQFILMEIHELVKYFPSVVVGDGNLSGNVLGLSYSPSRIGGYDRHTMGSNTHNIVMASTKPLFYVGYGANSAGGRKSFSFEYDMNKTKQRLLFQQVLEYLVSVAYSSYSNDKSKQPQVWMGYDRLL